MALISWYFWQTAVNAAPILGLTRSYCLEKDILYYGLGLLITDTVLQLWNQWVGLIMLKPWLLFFKKRLGLLNNYSIGCQTVTCDRNGQFPLITRWVCQNLLAKLWLIMWLNSDLAYQFREVYNFLFENVTNSFSRTCTDSDQCFLYVTRKSSCVRQSHVQCYMV